MAHQDERGVRISNRTKKLALKGLAAAFAVIALGSMVYTFVPSVRPSADNQATTILGSIGYALDIQHTNTESAKSAIPPTTKYYDDPSVYVTVSQVDDPGHPGEQTTTYKLTYRGNKLISRKQIKNVVTKQPEQRIISNGTKPFLPILQPQPLLNLGGRIGAVCKDGWQSSATGSGACSYHGGVASWLY